MSFTDGAEDQPDNSFTPAQPGERQLSLPPGLSRGGSPIQNIVNFFRQQNPNSQPSNQPSRQAQPMQGRTPFVLPGTNQTFDWSRPTPSVPDKPPPAPRGLSPVPPNFPQPKGAFTPYIPSRYDRHYSQWGTPDQFGMEPQGWETPHIAKGVGQFFSQFGSIPMMGIGRNMNQFADAYIKSYMQGKDFLAKQRLEDLNYNMKLADYQQQEELHAYADLFDEYSAMDPSASGDVSKLQNFTIGGVSFGQALYNKAHELNDQQVINMLDGNGSVANVIDMLNHREKRWRDLNSANKSADKQAERDAAAAQSTAEVAAEGLPTEPLPPSTATTPEDPTHIGPPTRQTIQPPSSAKATAPADFAQPVAGQQPDPKEQPAQHPLHDAGAAYFRTGRQDELPKDAIQAAAAKRYAETLPAVLSGIANDKSLTPDQKIAKLNAINPAYADDLKAILQYKEPDVGGQGQGGGASVPYRNALNTFARNIKPNWSPQNYAVIQDWLKGSSKEAQTIQRGTTALSAGKLVNDDLDAIQKRDGLKANSVLGDLSNTLWHSDPLYAQLRSDWLLFNQDVNALTVPGGSVTETGAQVDVIPQEARLFTGSPAAYRGVVQHHMSVAADRIGVFQRQWDSYGRDDPMPWISQEEKSHMRDMARTGFYPGEIVVDGSGNRGRYLGDGKWEDAN